MTLVSGVGFSNHRNPNQAGIDAAKQAMEKAGIEQPDFVFLFGSIGYTQSFRNLMKTFENFHSHLNDEGLVIVEPWVFKQDFKREHVSLDTLENDDLKFVRMARSKLTRSRWLIYMHYLIGAQGTIQYSSEVHEMLALDYPDYIKAFESAGFKDPKFLRTNLWKGNRGLFLANKGRQ